MIDQKTYQKQYYLDNKDKLDAYRKQWALDNKDRLDASRKHRNNINKDKLKAYKHQYYLNNKEKMSMLGKQYVDNNRETYLQYQHEYSKQRNEEFYLKWYNVGCCKCGESAISWHHIDSTTKLYNVSNMKRKPDELVKEEIAKCIPLCKSCHAKLHNAIRTRGVV